MPWRARVALRPVPSQNSLLRHKTTYRRVYVERLQELGEVDEVLLWNERGEATEFSIGNLVARFGDEWRTPPVSCGLLPGTYRRWLLEQGRVREAVIRLEDLANADELRMVNSVAGKVPVVLLPGA